MRRLPPSRRAAFELPILLMAGFRSITETLHDELARRGHPKARPIHGFTLQAIGPGGAKVTEIAGRLGVTKQAAAKTVASLEELGYARRRKHPGDARAVLISKTARGDDLLDQSVAIFAEIRVSWSETIGPDRVRELEDDLERIALRSGDQGGAGFLSFLGFIS